MSRLDELILELCPNGVEYKQLKDLGVFYGGLTGKSKDDFENGNKIFITYKNVYSNPSLDLHPAERVKIGETENQRTLKYGDVIFTGSSETPDECGISSVVTEIPQDDLYLNSFCFIFRFDDLNGIYPPFMKHLFRSSSIRKQIGRTANGVTRYNVSKKLMAKISIPIPPMDIQKEIVRLLDDFTAKTAELQAVLNKEYEARKKQYEYYKEVLLCNNENVDKVKIKDIVCKTNKIKWNQTENTYQYIDLSSVDRETHTLLNTSIIDRNNAPSRAQQIVCVDDVLFGTTRPMLKRLCVIPDEYDGQICSTGFCVLRAIDNIVQPKWIYHVLNTTQFYSYVESHQQGTSYPSISDSLVKEYEITLPSLDEQIRIINILDNLEETNFELNNNLSLELESRQKQYEFYRDKLLTFNELS